MDNKELKTGEHYQNNMDLLRYQKIDISESMFPSIKDLTPQYGISQEVWKNLMPNGDPIEIDTPPFAEHMEKTERYQKQSLEILQAISDNTASLQMIVELIAKTNDNQDEIITMLNEILSIAKANNKADAASMYKKISKSITGTVESAESIYKLLAWANTIYTMVIANLPQ